MADGGSTGVRDRMLRGLLALSLFVFGAGHFLAVASAGANRAAFTGVMPHWLPWPLFWIGLFGAAFVAAGIGIAGNLLLRWGAAGLGAMFALWVFTLHLPRVLGLYSIPGGVHYPDEVSSLLIAVALWGGAWALAGRTEPPRRKGTKTPICGT